MRVRMRVRERQRTARAASKPARPRSMGARSEPIPLLPPPRPAPPRPAPPRPAPSRRRRHDAEGRGR